MLSLVMLIFGAFTSIFVDRKVSALEEERNTIAISIADRVGFELDRALVEGEGYSRTTTLRSSIRGEDYNLTLANGTVLLSYGRTSVRGYTAAENVSGSFEPGLNRISNEGGVIHVEQP